MHTSIHRLLRRAERKVHAAIGPILPRPAPLPLLIGGGVADHGGAGGNRLKRRRRRPERAAAVHVRRVHLLHLRLLRRRIHPRRRPHHAERRRIGSTGHFLRDRLRIVNRQMQKLSTPKLEIVRIIKGKNIKKNLKKIENFVEH